MNTAERDGAELSMRLHLSRESREKGHHRWILLWSCPPFEGQNLHIKKERHCFFYNSIFHIIQKEQCRYEEISSSRPETSSLDKRWVTQQQLHCVRTFSTVFSNCYESVSKGLPQLEIQRTISQLLLMKLGGHNKRAKKKRKRDRSKMAWPWGGLWH